MTRPVHRLMNWLTNRLTNRLMSALREKPSRFGYVLGAMVVSVVLFTMADILPAPYDYTR